MTTSISVIIPTLNRTELLQDCIDSILREFIDVEIIVVVTGEDQKTLDLLKSYKVKTLHLNNVTPGEARNYAISFSRGDMIGFFDDDIVMPNNYKNILYEIISKHKDYDVIGGPDMTSPDATNLEKIIGLSLVSPLATFKTSCRHFNKGHIDVKADETKLILCNLWIRKMTLRNLNLTFDKRLIRNEENVLIEKIKFHNKKIIFSPDLFVYHKRKTNIYKFVKAIYLSGNCRANSFQYYPELFSWEYFIPSLFVLYLILTIFYHNIFMIPLIIYVVLNAYLSFKVSMNKNIFFPFFIFIYTIIINVTYGLGFLSGYLIKNHLLSKKEFGHR